MTASRVPRKRSRNSHLEAGTGEVDALQSGSRYQWGLSHGEQGTVCAHKVVQRRQTAREFEVLSFNADFGVGGVRAFLVIVLQLLDEVVNKPVVEASPPE